MIVNDYLYNAFECISDEALSSITKVDSTSINFINFNIDYLSN